jgi:D-alanine-D-alanine ligase
MKKINLGLLFGGQSAEHAVSLQSVQNIIEAIDKEKYDLTLIGIDKSGQWNLYTNDMILQAGNSLENIKEKNDGNMVFTLGDEMKKDVLSCKGGMRQAIDVVFPVLHGTNGEDGTVQGLLKLANIPCVGAGVLASAIGMDKDVTKRILRDAGIDIARFKTYFYWQQEQIDFQDISSELGLPLFIKPANAGSSVGVSKVHDALTFAEAIKNAFQFDNKILIEEAIAGRELECGILGNEQPQASVVGEIIAQTEFYSYDAKYRDENGAILELPANLSAVLSKKIQTVAIQVFQALGCEGMARVDCFLTKDQRIIVNEINTIPGFTKISMYPKLWELSGVSYPNLIHRLIQLALERYKREQRLRMSYDD